jgi:hypothetical protein
MATYDEILRQIAYNESRGIPTARNPYSSAGGMFQFIDTTWGNVLRRMNPEQFGNMTNAQLAPLKTDPKYVDLQQQAAQFHLQNDIAPTLEKRGVPMTPGTAYLSWFQGPAGAAKLYNAPEGTRISDMFPETIAANKNMKFNGKPYAEWTREDAIGWANNKMGGTGQTPAMPTQQAPATQMADVKGYLAPASAAELAPAGTWSRFGQDFLGGMTGGLLGTSWSTPAANAAQPTQVASMAPVAAPQPTQFPAATPGMADKVTLPASVGQPTMPQMPGLNAGAGYQAPPASAMQPTSQSLFNPAPSALSTAGSLASLANVGLGLMAAGAEKPSWQPGAPAPVQRGQWRDIIFSGLLG